ncbi:MAG: Ig-like domain-containing protein, partial [Acidobacteriota bacterium]
GTATATVRLTILPVNDPPTARSDSVVLENSATRSIDVLGNDSDVDGDPLTITSVTNPAHGKVVLSQSGTLITYTPVEPGYTGEDHFNYVISDGQGGQSTAAVSVTVTAGSTPLLAVNDSVTLKEDSSRVINVLSNDSNPGGGPLTIALVELPKSGKATVQGNAVTYTPDPDFFGSDSFTYKVLDSSGDVSAVATVSITVTPVNDPPYPESDSGVTGPQTELDLDVLLNDEDPDGDVLRVSKVIQPQHGQVTIAKDGTLSYVPNEGFTGIDSFHYWASDGTVAVPALVRLEVIAAPAANSLLFPASISDGSPPLGDLFVGLALLNTENRFDQVRVQAIDAVGEEIAHSLRAETLPPNGQRAFLASELSGDGRAQYITASSFTQDLQGIVVVGDYARRRMDGIGALPVSGRELYVPEVLMSADTKTFLQLINREDHSGSVDLELYDGQSRRPARWSGTITPSGSLRGLVSDFFGSSNGFQGYIKVISDVEVSGIAVSVGTKWLSMVPTMLPQNARTWFAPHVFADKNGGDTYIRILSTGLLDSFADITVFDDAGQAISTRRVFLPTDKLTVVSASSLFGGLLETSGILSGSISVTIEGAGDVPPPKVALITYVTPKARTTAPLLSEGRKDTIFPQVAHSRADRIFTGLAMFNPSAATAKITIDIYDADGRNTARAQLNLPAKARKVGLLGDPQLFGPDFQQVGGHIRIQSDRPIVSYITLGDDAGETLSALAP